MHTSRTSAALAPGVRVGLSLALFFALPPRLTAQSDVSIADAAKKLTEIHQWGRLIEAHAFTADLLKGDPKHAAQVLGRVMRNRDVKSRSHVVVAIEHADLKEAIPILTQLLDDPEDSFRHFCAGALGRLADKKAIPDMEQRLAREPHQGIQEHIRFALAQLGRPYLGYFVTGLHDRNRERRRRCLNYLGHLKDPRAVPRVIKLLGSDDDWDVLDARACLSRITEIPNSIVLKKTVHPDGSVSTEGRTRPHGEFKQDCDRWLEQHALEAGRPMAPAPEAWTFTTEPMLLAFEVSFAMSAEEVLAVYKKAGIECKHLPAQRDGHKLISLESISAARTPAAIVNERLMGRVGFTFKNGRLAEVHLTLARGHKGDGLDPLMTPLRLSNPNRRGWIGLDGTIRLVAGRGNAEGTAWTISLRDQIE